MLKILNNIDRSMDKIVICGITGFTGKFISNHLMSLGYEVKSINRQDFLKNDAHIKSIIANSKALINLAGAPIMKRWTKKWRNEIYNSRILITRRLVHIINDMNNPPEVFISSSAVGIYDSTHIHAEDSKFYDNGFLGKICIDWEREALRTSPKTRVVIFRLGVVLSRHGGALKKLIVPFKMGLGGRVGSGIQYFPFVHIDDVCNFVNWAVTNNSASGVYNLVAPQVINNKQFTSVLANVIKMPAFFTVPSFVLKVLYGEAAQIVTKGQQVKPTRLLAHGFKFRFHDIYAALKHEFMPDNS